MHPSNQSENQTSLYGLEESEFEQVIDYGLEESVPEHIALQEPSNNKLLVEENKELRALFWKKDLAYSEILQKKNEQNTIPQEESETFSWLMEINTTLNAQLEEQNRAYSELFQKNSELNSQFTEKENHLNKLNTELELQKSLNTNLKAHLGKTAQETKRTTVQLQAQLTDKDAQLRALQAQLDSKDTPQTLMQAKNINSQEQTQERIEELIPTPMPIRQESSFIAISEDQNVSDEPEQKSEIVPAQHTEDRKIVDNSGEGNCMYYAYGISLMYYLRSKNDEDLSETVFNRLNLKNKEKEQLKTLLFKDKRQHFSDSSIKLVIEPIFNRAARDLVAKHARVRLTTIRKHCE